MKHVINLSRITDQLQLNFIFINLKILPSVLLLSILYFIFFILNILDAHSTYKVVSIGNYKNEKNPVARFFIKKFGPLKGIIIIKLSSLLVVLIMLFKYGKTFTKDFNIILLFSDVLYVYVVIHNYKNLFRMINKKEILNKDL